jgi:SagB-type dehydrogenase family enzyme
MAGARGGGTPIARPSSMLRFAVILAAVAALPLPALGEDVIELPEPSAESDVSLEEALTARRSRRSYSEGKLTREQIGQLFWAAQGVTSDRGGRTAPSAGARYPLEVYVVAHDGVYHYLPKRHAMKRIKSGDLRSKLWDEVYARDSLRGAAAAFVIGGVYARTEKRYGKRARRYVHMEAGHACQNLLLQATALGLDAVSLGAFHGRKLRKIAGLPKAPDLLYVIPVGHPAER